MKNLSEYINNRFFRVITKASRALNYESYVIGGYVRDILLNRPSNDIDVVVVGSGIAMAEALGRKLGRRAHVSVFRNFGTAQVKYRDTEVEFVGARKESYSHDSRKPVVENGTLEDDQNRRDFTINAMAICLNSERFGELVDPFDGMTVLFNNTLYASASATSGQAMAIVGDLDGLQVNYPEGDSVAIKYDDLSLAEKDLVKIVGRQYAAHAVTAPGKFCNLAKPAPTT
mgnify:CR=1 FL=1